MKPRRVCAVSFSPTGKSEELARLLSAELAAFTGAAQSFFSLNLPRERAGVLRFARDDLVVAVSPVYAGRLPNKLAPDFARVLRGDGTPVLAVCAFGNRSPGDALREWLLLLEAGGFVPLGAMAAACRHAFTDDVGRGRPDTQDRAELLAFARAAAAKLGAPELFPLAYDRETPLAPYYTPLRADGLPAKFLKAKPVCLENCTRCGVCADVCPMGSVDRDTLETPGVCIKCQACVRACPEGARVLTDADFLSHAAMLREHFTARAANTVLL